MLDQIEATILSALQTIFDQFGWVGVFGLMAFENATGITPSEIILALAGWMLIERHEISLVMIPLGGLYAALGSVSGASIIYWVARLGGRPVIERFARLLRIDMAHLTRVEGQIHKFGTGLILIGRVIPGIRTLISIPAGLVRIPFLKFILATFAGTYVWCTLLIGFGYVLGREWMLISQYIKHYLPFVLAGGCLASLAYLAYQYRTRLPFISTWMTGNKLSGKTSRRLP